MQHAPMKEQLLGVPHILIIQLWPSQESHNWGKTHIVIRQRHVSQIHNTFFPNFSAPYGNSCLFTARKKAT
jgi:hypothetical protein